MTLLSIIIPTKDRYETLLPVVKALLFYINSNDYEIIVQDNSTSNDYIRDFLSQTTDNRLKYFYTPEAIPIADNTNQAIANSTGKYITFIGDDDLVSPYIVDIVRIMEKKEIKCLLGQNAYYWWSNVIFHKETHYKRKGALSIPKASDSIIRTLYSKDELNYVLKNGASNLDLLPRLYHGIVKREVLEAIKERVGQYCPGSSPDMGLAVSIALILDSYSYINFPVTIFGGSKNSGAGMGASKSHYGKIEEKNFLPNDILERWDPFIPKIWSAYTIYAQTAIEILQLFNSDKKVNYNALYAAIFVNEPYLRSYLMPCLKKAVKSKVAKPHHMLYYTMRKIGGRTLNKLKVSTKQVNLKVFIKYDISKCMGILKKELPFNFHQ